MMEAIGIPKKSLAAPARIAFLYLIVTYVLFLMGPLRAEVNNLLTLTVFVAVNYIAFLFGGYATARSLSRQQYLLPPGGTKLSTSQNWLVIVGSLYLGLYGINFTVEYGASSLSEVIAKIMSPGASYQSKFEVYELQRVTGYVSRTLQIFTIFSLVYAAVVPFGAFRWRELQLPQKVLLVLGLVIYALSFLAVGTMKGLGDLIVFVAAGTLARHASDSLSRRGNTVSARRRDARRRQGILAVIALFLAAITYMIGLQISRANAFGITYSPVVGDVSETLIAQLFGQNVAFGVYSVLAYPSHGYLGLSYNLDQPFIFSYLAGLLPAFESYRNQFLGGESNVYLVYLFRTEAATGWPAGMYWSTIFPWLASDLSFWGTPVFMFVVGGLLVRVWASCITTGSALSLAALGQLALGIAFIPANNQVLSSRVGLWVVASLLAIWLVKTVMRKI